MYYAAVPVQYMQCAALIAKVMISEEGRFTESEIQLARELLENNTWNSDVRNFLRVIAKITYVGVDVYDEAYAALTHRRARS